MGKGILMTEKTKRKGNPRRRTLFRLILLAGIVATIISYAVYSLLPDGAEIVFIAPDDNGIDQIWLANLNHPENPRQLTFHPHGLNIISLQASQQSDVILYIVDPGDNFSIYEHEILIFNLNEPDQRTVMSCEFCSQLELSPDGKYIVYEQKITDDNNRQTIIRINVYEIANRQRRTLYEFGGDSYIHHSTSPDWVGYTGLLSYLAVSDDAEYRIFDLETNLIVSTTIYEKRSGRIQSGYFFR